jgi:polar amino acid transport system substrate-binding protein
MSKSPGDFVILDETLDDEYYGIGCRKGAVTLREAIDKALDELNEDGTIDKICDKWFGENIVVRDIPKQTQEELDAAKAKQE